MATLALLQHATGARARLRDALAEDHDLLHADDWTGLTDLIHTRSVDGVVVDVHDRFRPVPVRELLDLRHRRPPLAIVVYSDFEGRERSLFELGRHGIDGVIVAGRDEDVRTIRETVRRAFGSSLAARIGWVLEGRLPNPALAALRWGVEHAHLSPGVTELAEALGRSPRVLAREHRRSGLPAPGRILLWARVFRATQLLESGHRSVEEVAYSLGYASATALARAFRTVTDAPPTEVLRRGGVAWVLEAFHGSRMRRLPPPRRARRLRPWTHRG